MGKLAVVFVAALAFQAALGWTSFQKEPQIVSGDVYELDQKTPFYPGFPQNTKYQGMYGSNYSEIQKIVQKLLVTLENVHFEDPLMKRAFEYVVHNYFENLREVLTPEYNRFYDMYDSKRTTFSVQEMKQFLSKFVKMALENIDHAPKFTYMTFVKATLQFETHLYNMYKTNTPLRQMSIRVQTFADVSTNWYECVPNKSFKFRTTVLEHAKQLFGVIGNYISKIEKLGADPEFLSAFKKIVSKLQENIDEQELVVIIQEATTEVRKYLISATKGTETKLAVGAEFIKVFAWVEKELGDPDGVDIWSRYLMIITNAMSEYLPTEFHVEDWNVLTKAFNLNFEILEKYSDVKYQQLTHTLKENIREYEAKNYTANGFLQKVALELSQFIWTVNEGKGDLSKDVIEIITRHLVATEKIHVERIAIKAFVSVQTVPEIIMQVQTVTDRLDQALHIFAPGFQSTKIRNRVFYFKQMLDLTMFGLQNLPSGYEKSSNSIKKAYDNLHKIYSHLEKVLEQPNTDVNAHLTVQIQNAFMVLRELGLEPEVQDKIEFVNIYSDFLFALEFLTNQVQADLQFIAGEYNVKTLTVQVEYVAHRISNLLHQAQAKSQLKQAIILQVEALEYEIEALFNAFKKMNGHKVFSELAVKYNKIYDELHRVTESGRNKSVESLSVFLDQHIKTVVTDLQMLVSHAEETPELSQIYRYILETFTYIMARVENVYYYEYYHVLVNKEYFADYVQQLVSKLNSKLQSTLVESEKIKYDLSLETLMFARHLQNIALRFQTDANVFPIGLYKIISEIEHFGSTSSVGINEFRTELSKYVSAVYSEVKKIVGEESYVGTEQIIINYILALEKLYFNVHHITESTHSDETFEEMDIHVHYLLQTIEQIHPENERAINVMPTEYRRFVSYVEILSKKISEFTGHSDKLKHIVKELDQIKAVESEYYSNVDGFRVNMVVGIKHLLIVIRETYWIMYEIEHNQKGSDVTSLFKSLYDEYLTTVQRMHFEIHTNIITNQRWYNLDNWGLTKTYFKKYHDTFNYDDKEYSKKYDHEYHGTFDKDVNNYGEKFNSISNGQFENNEENSKYSKHSQNFRKPEYTFGGFSNQKHFDSKKSFEDRYYQGHTKGSTFFQVFNIFQAAPADTKYTEEY